jgi:MFS family permease
VRSLESRESSPIIRVVSGAGAVLLALVGLVVSFGAILGAPVGIWLVGRWTKRHDRRPSGIASLFGAALSSTITAAILWSILFAVAPHPDRNELKSAVVKSQAQSPAKLPDWYVKVFPSTARTDSATRMFEDSVAQKLASSSVFPKLVFGIGILILAVLFGSVGGAAGWGSHRLFRIAFLHQDAGIIVATILVALLVACQRSSELKGVYVSVDASGTLFPCDSANVALIVPDSGLALRYHSMAGAAADPFFVRLRGVKRRSGSIYSGRRWFQVQQILEIRPRAAGECPNVAHSASSILPSQ